MKRVHFLPSSHLELSNAEMRFSATRQEVCGCVINSKELRTRMKTPPFRSKERRGEIFLLEILQSIELCICFRCFLTV